MIRRVCPSGNRRYRTGISGALFPASSPGSFGEHASANTVVGSPLSDFQAHNPPKLLASALTKLMKKYVYELLQMMILMKFCIMTERKIRGISH